MIVDRVSRWDEEWRGYRGGQNTPLTILDIGNLDEQRLPHDDRTTDTQPVWLGNTIYFLSDRDLATNIWAFDVTSRAAPGDPLQQRGVKSLSGRDGLLVFEQDGWIHTHEIASGTTRRVDITVRGDFPWAQPRWVPGAASRPHRSAVQEALQLLQQQGGRPTVTPPPFPTPSRWPPPGGG